MKRLWPIGVFLLNGCAEPSFSFRGYTELSECRSVIDAELGGGSSFVEAVDTEMPLGEGFVTELSGELYTVPVAIFVSCYTNGTVSAIEYISEVTDPDASAANFANMAQGLDSIFGEPLALESEQSRSRTYHCGDPATVNLREARHGDMDFEVSLLVMPLPVTC